MKDFNMGEDSERRIADVKLSPSEKQSHMSEGKNIPHMDKEQLRDLITTLDENIKKYIRFSRHNFERALALDQRKQRAELRLEELGMKIEEPE
jgi:hypothetical protein